MEFYFRHDLPYPDTCAALGQACENAGLECIITWGEHQMNDEIPAPYTPIYDDAAFRYRGYPNSKRSKSYRAFPDESIYIEVRENFRPSGVQGFHLSPLSLRES